MTETNEQTEMLARMWIECDPNRGGGPAADDPIDVEGGTMNGQPTWHWFIPRAEASIEYLGEARLPAGEGRWLSQNVSSKPVARSRSGIRVQPTGRRFRANALTAKFKTLAISHPLSFNKGQTDE